MKTLKSKFLKWVLLGVMLVALVGMIPQSAFAASIAGITSDTKAVLKTGYHFSPRYLKGQTKMTYSQAPSGYKWVVLDGGETIKLTKNGESYVLPSSYRNKVWVKYSNVGTYYGKDVDMKITLTTWTSSAQTLQFGKNVIGFGNASSNKGGTKDYVQAQIDYYYAGTTVLYDGLKGHQNVSDIDYWKKYGTSEWIKTKKNTGDYIIPAESQSKLNLSKVASNYVGATKEAINGDNLNNSDGANFIYYFDKPSHVIRWHGAFLQMNQLCPDKEFEIIYMKNHKDAVGSMDPTIVKYGVSTKTNTKTYTRNGYHIAHWHVYRDFDDSWSTTDGWSTKKPSSCSEFSHYSVGGNVSQTARCGNVYFYACWAKNTYTVKYNANATDVTGETASSTHAYDVAKNLTKNGYNRPGHEFLGWATSPDGNVVYKDSESVKNLTETHGATVNLYAVWKPLQATYTIKHVTESGILLGTGAKTNYLGVTLEIQPNSYTGYKSPSAQMVTWDTLDSKTITFTYKPIEYNIYVDCNGGSGVENRTYNIETPTFSIGTPTWSDGSKVFEGWTGSNGDTPEVDITIPKGSTGHKHYVAHWEGQPYKIHYDANGGSGTMTDSTHQYGIPSKLSANLYSKTGYSFTGWNTDPNGNGTAYKNKDTVTTASQPNTTLILYAQWATINTNLTVQYDANGGIILGSSKYKVIDNLVNDIKNNTIYKDVIKYGDRITQLTSNEEFAITKDKYEFVGWTTSRQAIYNENMVKDVDYFNITDSQLMASDICSTLASGDQTMTLYALWKPANYQVIYNPNGGVGVMANSTHEFRVEKNLSTNTYTMIGHRFYGWNTKADGTGIYYVDKQPVVDIADGNSVTLYAQWKKYELIVDYNADDGYIHHSKLRSYSIINNMIQDLLK